jgi:hypothetical protein
MSEPLALPQTDIGAALTDMWRSVLLFVPKALAFIAILVIGYFIAKFVRKLVDRVLERVGFDRAVERSGLGRTMARARYDASDILARLVYYAVLLFTLQLAFGVWGPNPISDLISAVISWLPRAFVAILIVVVAAAIAAAVRDLITGALGGLSYGRLIANVVSIFIIALGVIAALNQVGIATTVTTPVLVAVLATIAGILIVGVGGGLVRPMQQRWERWLERMATESAVIRERAKAYQAEKAEEERRRVDAERARADEERQRAQERAAATTTTIPTPEPGLTSSPNPPAPAYPPATPAPTPMPSSAPADDSDRTQVIPRTDVAAATTDPAGPVAGTTPAPMSGATPPRAEPAEVSEPPTGPSTETTRTREIPAVDADEGALYQGGTAPSPDGRAAPEAGPTSEGRPANDETQVIRREEYRGN